MHKSKIGIFLLLCVSTLLTAESLQKEKKPFGKMNLNQIESLSYNELTPDDQNELIKLAIFSGNEGYIVPGTLAHRESARTVLRREFDSQNWLKLENMLVTKGIDAVKTALKEGTAKGVDSAAAIKAAALKKGAPTPERRPIKLKEGEGELTPPPLPPRPATGGNALTKPLATPGPQGTPERRPIKLKEGEGELTPPPLPPRPATGGNALTKPLATPGLQGTPERRPIKLKEGEGELTPPPLPPRPATGGNALTKPLATPGTQGTSEGTKQTPPPLPPRPPVKQPVEQQHPNSALLFSGADLEQQKGQLKKPTPSQATPQKGSYLQQALSEKFKGANPVEDEPDDGDGWD